MQKKDLLILHLAEGIPTYFLRMSSITRKKLLSLAATISFAVVILLTPYYSYISSDLPKDMRYIFLHWNNSMKQKYQLRFGTTFSLLNNIVNRTPPDAIIIMPPDSVLLNPKSKMKFIKEIVEKNWSSYFVYPRKLVYEKEKSTNPLYEKANYILILNGWGLDKIHYKLENKIETGVIPINL